jgi:hypothetical protein
VVIVINAAARREVAQRVEMVVKRGLAISREMPERLGKAVALAHRHRLPWDPATTGGGRPGLLRCW